MAGRVPTVMVSSTFYDLREVRQQLKRMIDEELGYRPLISEAPSFPIDPDAETIENCRLVVERDVDILVLVISRRYGTVETKSQKSVTNLEYSAARAKGIPIFAFIEREALTLFEAWRQTTPGNRSAFEQTVDDARLFVFIEGVRAKVWTNSFTHAADLTGAIRTQFAYLMMRGLSLQRKLATHPSREVLDSLSPEAFRLAVDFPALWEPSLFAQVMEDEIRAVADLRREYDLKLFYGASATISDADVFSWIRLRIHEVGKLISNAQAIVEDALPAAFGEPGKAGSLDEVVFVARQLIKIYRGVIEWSQGVRRTRTASDDMQVVLDELAQVGAFVIEEVVKFPSLIRQHRDEMIAYKDAGFVGEPPSVTLRFDVVNTEQVSAAMEKVLRDRGIDPDATPTS